MDDVLDFIFAQPNFFFFLRVQRKIQILNATSMIIQKVKQQFNSCLRIISDINRQRTNISTTNVAEIELFFQNGNLGSNRLRSEWDTDDRSSSNYHLETHVHFMHINAFVSDYHFF